ncbi:CubicO group peptidase, beta-lactamase class C family [Marivirga sericea]|uniref:CubicO group peptidase, beta-lactamase class C family n=1 Tax=Marivirga sericea TaxID=1028 RepID=A0A1X7K6E8_9BACT|nr:serine hydrolase [Marivirga sericea]SMG35812.1 CubicO group peptidase, beta-lactamase class C family [Marivirga sericea]
MKKIALLTLFSIVFFSGSAQNEDSRLKGLEKEVEYWLETYKAMGLSISIVEKDSILFNRGFGYRDVESESPVNENTVFPIASCSKAFTASLLGILEAENQLSLKNKPSDYIPTLKFYDDKMDDLITLEDLLTHKSGLGAVNGTLVLFPESDRSEVLEKLQYLEPEGEVKESSIYSNMGYTVAGAVAEKVANKAWEDLIQNRIFEPLKMASSFTDLENARGSNNFSLGYGLHENEIHQVQFEEYHNYKPAGGIRSTSTDMAQWMLAWLNEGVVNRKQILPTSYVKKARKFYNERGGEYEPSLFLTGYGLGWRVEAQNGDFKVYHGGNSSGFSTLVVTYPFRNLGITILSNQDDSILPYVIADIIKNRMFESERIDDYPVLVSDVYQKDELNMAMNAAKMPTHSLDSFVGEYEHKGYGKIEIVLEEDKLYAIYPSYKFFLEHLHHNVFVMKPLEDISDIMNPEFAVNFRTNNSDEISSLTINLQSVPVEFTKISRK